MMKKILLFLIAIIVTTGVTYAQDDETIEKNRINTIFNGPPEKISGFVGPMASSSMINSEFAYFNGFQVALLLNNKFFIGGYRLDLQNNVTSRVSNVEEYDIDYDSRGLLLGYVFFPNKAVHFSVAGQFGNANIDIYDSVIDQWIDDNNVFEVTPVVELEINLAKFCKLGIGANYRLAFDVDQFSEYDNNDFSGPGAFMSLKFGWFY